MDGIIEHTIKKAIGDIQNNTIEPKSHLKSFGIKWYTFTKTQYTKRIK